MLSFLGCKPKNGSNDFQHSVTITSASCEVLPAPVTSGNGVMTLTLQNNAAMTAILVGEYLLSTISSGLYCTYSSGTEIIAFASNSSNIELSAFGTGTAILFCANQDSGCPTTGDTIICTVAPFSEQTGWYEITTQQITCS